jgi:hypothetical protein
MVVEFCRVSILPPAFTRPAPSVEWTDRNHSAFRWRHRGDPGTVLYTRDPSGRRAHTACHEVAHWATPDDPGHGPEWRRVYALLLREFVGSDFADRFLVECDRQPVRRKPRKFVVQRWSPDPGRWVDATPEEAQEIRADKSSAAWLRRSPCYFKYLWSSEGKRKFRMIDADQIS